MPIYEHQCTECGKTIKEFRKLKDWNQAPTCPECLIPMPQVYGAAIRTNYKRPIRMQSMGFLADPADVTEHRRRFPGVDLSFEQGSAIPVMRSLNQKRKYMKAMGWVDRNSFT